MAATPMEIIYDREKMEKDRKINPNELDLEAVQQADLFFEWSEELTFADAEVERQELQLDVLEAQIQIKVRESPSSFGIAPDRCTEAAIKAAVQIQKNLIDARLALIHAKARAKMLSKAVQSMDQKKRMIEVLVDLFGRQYFAGPKAPRDIVQAWEAKQQSSTKVTELQKSRSRRVTR